MWSPLTITIPNCTDSLPISHGCHSSGLILVSVICKVWMKVLQKHQPAYFAGLSGRMTVKDHEHHCHYHVGGRHSETNYWMETVGITCSWIKGQSILTIEALRRLGVPHSSQNWAHKCPLKKGQDTSVHSASPFPFICYNNPPKTAVTRIPFTERETEAQNDPVLQIQGIADLGRGSISWGQVPLSLFLSGCTSLSPIDEPDCTMLASSRAL